MGTTAGFQNLIMEVLGHVIIFSNPITVPTVSYEYLFCHPPARRKARRLLSRSYTSDTVSHQLRPNNLDMINSSSNKTA
jgi:hypothetical protein